MAKQKNIQLFTLLAAFALFFMSACGGRTDVEQPKQTTTNTAEKRGEEIVTEYLKRDAAPFRKIRVRFIVTAEDKPIEVYELDTWRKQTAEGTTTLSQIVKPADEASSTLTIEPKGQKATVIAYAAARGDFIETDTNKRFIGGLTAGELLGEWDKFAFKLLDEKEFDGQKAFEVDGTLKPDADSTISRMDAFFRSDNYLPVELHLFDAVGREIRTYKFTDFKDDPEHPYASRTEVENPIFKAHITVEILSRELPAKIDDAMFTREKLKEFVKK